MDFTLITVRTMEQGMYIDEKRSKEYDDAVSYCEMNEDDMKNLGVEEGDRVRLVTDYGSVVLRVKRPQLEVPKGIIVVPLGPYANALTPSESGSGTPIYKGLRCRVEVVK